MMPAVSASQRSASSSASPGLGILFKLMSVTCLSAMAACVKALGPDIPAAQTIFFRGLLAMAVLAVIAWRTEGLHLLKARNWRGHAGRSIAGSLSMFGWFTALSLIPLAQVTAITFSIPLFLTVLAMLFLGERIFWYRWTALGIGFAGVLIMIGPAVFASQGNTIGIGMCLIAAVLAAFALLFLRSMSGKEHALTITFWFFVTSTSMALVTLLFSSWPAPTQEQWLLLGMTGIFGVLGQLFMSYTYRYAEASLVAPLEYINMIISMSIGYYVFSEIPGWSIWIGAPLVMLSGAIILWREYVQHKRARISTAGVN